MKRLVFLFVLSFLCITTNAQWTLEYTYPNANYLWQLEAVGENVLWGAVSLNSGIKGIFKTTDEGNTWYTDTLDISRITCMHARSATTAYCGILDNSSIRRIIKTTDGGLTWFIQSSAFGGSPSTLLWVERIYFFDDNNGFAFGDQYDGYNVIYTTTNGGDNWIQVPNSNIPSSFNNEWPINTTYYVLENTIWIPVYVYNGSQVRIFKSTDKGYTWTSSNPFSTVITDLHPSAIVFKNQMEGILIISRCYFDNTSTYKMYKTSDGGETWIETSFSLPIDPAFMCSVPGNPEAFVVTAPLTNVGSGYTLDGGNSWQLIENSLDLALTTFTSGSVGWSTSWNSPIIYKWSGPALPVELISFTAQAQDQKVILKWSTATELNNNGFEIQRKVAEGDFATVGFVRGEGTTTNQKEYSYVDKDLVDGKYYYRLKQIDYNGTYEYSDVIEVDVRSLNDYALEQNFPNPFNPITTIGYVLREKTIAKLILLNAIGEEMAILVNEEQEKGFHMIDFNASTLASGVYFYRLQAGDFVQTRKMILIK